MVSALHSSRLGGTKQFCNKGLTIGWSDIRAMKARDDERSLAGQLRCVRGLLQSFIDRDAWTRLNVKPAKIMQQEEVLAELHEHSQSDSVNCTSTKATFEYLSACNLLFENGFLCK